MGPELRPTRFRSIAPTVPVADVPAASAYYRDTLGFKIHPVMTDSAGYWVVAARDGVELQLVQAGGLADPGPVSFSILADSVDALAAELLARGAMFESGPTSQEYGRRDFAIRDLDGNVIGFWQPLPPAEGKQVPAVPDGCDPR